MSRHLLLATSLSIFLVACSPRSESGLDPVQAEAIAQEAREGCVADSLELVQFLADGLAPLCGADTVDALHGSAAAAGWSAGEVEPGVHLLVRHDVILRGRPTIVALHVLLTSDGVPVLEPALMDGMVVEVTADSVGVTTEGTLWVDKDPARGLVFSGTLDTTYADGCAVAADLDAAGRTIADLPGLDLGLSFTQGSVDLAIRDADLYDMRGTAALVGRSALVVVQLGSVSSQGELTLGSHGS